MVLLFYFLYFYYPVACLRLPACLPGNNSQSAVKKPSHSSMLRSSCPQQPTPASWAWTPIPHTPYPIPMHPCSLESIIMYHHVPILEDVHVCTYTCTTTLDGISCQPGLLFILVACYHWIGCSYSDWSWEIGNGPMEWQL